MVFDAGVLSLVLRHPVTHAHVPACCNQCAGAASALGGHFGIGSEFAGVVHELNGAIPGAGNPSPCFDHSVNRAIIIFGDMMTGYERVDGQHIDPLLDDLRHNGVDYRLQDNAAAVGAQGDDEPSFPAVNK